MVHQSNHRITTCGTALHLVNKGVGTKGGKYLHCYKARKGLCKAKAVRLDFSENFFAEILSKLDSLALVQDSSLKIAKDLGIVVVKIAELQSRLDQSIEIFAGYPSVAVAGLIKKAEQDLLVLVAEKEALNLALTAEEITDKTEFLTKLDLVTRSGRNRANTLLKRLKVIVCVGPDYYIVVQGVNPIFLISFHRNLKRFFYVPLIKDQLDRLIKQGTGSLQDVVYEMQMIASFANRNGIDGGKLMMSYIDDDKNS